MPAMLTTRAKPVMRIFHSLAFQSKMAAGPNNSGLVTGGCESSASAPLAGPLHPPGLARGAKCAHDPAATQRRARPRRRHVDVTGEWRNPAGRSSMRPASGNVGTILQPAITMRGASAPAKATNAAGFFCAQRDTNPGPFVAPDRSALLATRALRESADLRVAGLANTRTTGHYFGRARSRAPNTNNTAAPESRIKTCP